ncbi:hypothetical protein MHI04_12170 [Lysinibacillus sp. FSL K6-1151]|jgi:hypothetical protein|uniref:hypothetical protein n=1 Tax=Lysinibacillus sp. FSL K6-1151 TaxID=2921465 RepID=UPI003159E644
MKHTKIISILLTFTLLISIVFPPAASAIEFTDNDQNESLYSETELLVPQLDTEEYNKYILDTENYINEHPEFKELYESFTDVERQYFWDSINTARTPFMNSLESEQFIVAPRVAPIVWFVAATCVKLVVKQIPKATVKFSSHAVIQANARQLSSKQVADAIVNGKKFMDKHTRARAIYDKDQNINVVFIGNSKEVVTVYKPDSGEIAKKFISSNWGW